MAERFEQRKLDEAKRILESVKGFKKPLEGSPGVDELKSRIDALDAQVAKIAALRAQITEAMNVRNHMAYELNDTVKRIRALVKGQFGDDSSEYEMVGRTRLSERKRPKAK